MHTLQKIGNVWQVGLELPAESGLRNFRLIASFTYESAAVQAVNMLNGGSFDKDVWTSRRDVWTSHQD